MRARERLRSAAPRRTRARGRRPDAPRRRQQGGRRALGLAPMRRVWPLAALAAIVAADRMILERRPPWIVVGLLDHPAHVATAALVLANLRPRSRGWRAAFLAGSLAPDVDHVPLALRTVHPSLDESLPAGGRARRRRGGRDRGRAPGRPGRRHARPLPARPGRRHRRAAAVAGHPAVARRAARALRHRLRDSRRTRYPESRPIAFSRFSKPRRHISPAPRSGVRDGRAPGAQAGASSPFGGVVPSAILVGRALRPARLPSESVSEGDCRFGTR
jgi:hypothetical protein